MLRHCCLADRKASSLRTRLLVLIGVVVIWLELSSALHHLNPTHSLTHSLMHHCHLHCFCCINIIQNGFPFCCQLVQIFLQYRLINKNDRRSLLGISAVCQLKLHFWWWYNETNIDCWFGHIPEAVCVNLRAMRCRCRHGVVLGAGYMPVCPSQTYTYYYFSAADETSSASFWVHFNIVTYLLIR